MSNNTPLMRQHASIKARYPGAVVLFRVGDFYETFGEDAVKTSRALNIVLTRRGNGSASDVELAGFPHHALDTYLPKLVRAGYRVAICDQLELPQTAKGLVKRGVTELVTPGVALSDHILEEKKNNFLAAIHIDKHVAGMALLDISTGEFYATEGQEEYIYKLIQRFKPAEILFEKSRRERLEACFGEECATFALDEWAFSFEYGHEKLVKHFATAHLKGFGINELHSAIAAAGAVLHYLEITEHKAVQHITSISRIDEGRYVWIDKFTANNLELTQARQEGGVSLLEVLDKTITAMGSRQLRRWITFPLSEKSAVDERLNAVEALYRCPDLAERIANCLRRIADLERLTSKIALQRVNPRELLQLKKSLQAIGPIRTVLGDEPDFYLTRCRSQLDECAFLLDKLEKELCDDAPLQTHQGGVIKDGVDAELDELRSISFSGKDRLVQLRDQEAKRTGISSLKIAFNRVFGYYLEVSHTYKDRIPPDWIRKQTLVNAERYVTEELKAYEEKILHAEERRIVIEQQRFLQLANHAAAFIPQIQQNARCLAELDCLSSFAQTAREYRYTKPEINDSAAIDIRGGRHPVIERQLPGGEAYVPNDVYLDDETQQILIITGPNMAGKSALLRQTALTVLMAQMGSFVPADSASIGLVDKVFTRVGASDNLARGESTFMVEMTETAGILNNLSARSLVLMDEIGRGTSTYDGVSIAWAVVEYLHNHKAFRPKTLFATHYHELNQLAEQLPRVKNFNVSVKETAGKIIFLRQLKLGGSEHSFGIHVAQLAGVPTEVVGRSAEILRTLERKERQTPPPRIPPSSPPFAVLDNEARQIIERLSAIDITAISPVEALLKLNELLALIPHRSPNERRMLGGNFPA